MFTYKFTPKASKQFLKLDRQRQKRIFKKLDHYLSKPNPLVYTEYVSDPKLGEFRFRIGDYRVIFDLEDDEIRIILVGHRREIYR